MADENEDKLLAHRGELVSKVEAVEKKLAPLYEKRDGVMKQIEHMRSSLQDGVGADIKKIEAEELVPARNALARVARVMGGRSLGDH